MKLFKFQHCHQYNTTKDNTTQIQHLRSPQLTSVCVFMSDYSYPLVTLMHSHHLAQNLSEINSSTALSNTGLAKMFVFHSAVQQIILSLSEVYVPIPTCEFHVRHGLNSSYRLIAKTLQCLQKTGDVTTILNPSVHTTSIQHAVSSLRSCSVHVLACPVATPASPQSNNFMQVNRRRSQVTLLLKKSYDQETYGIQ